MSGARAEAQRAEPARAPLAELSGIGPARTRALARLGLATLLDLLLFVPRALEESAESATLRDASAAVGRRVRVRGRVRGLRLFRQGRRRSVLSGSLDDGDGTLGLLYFNQPWQLERLRAAERARAELVLEGRVVVTRRGAALAAPRMVGAGEGESVCRPVYALTEGLGQELLRRLAREAVERYADGLVDPLRAERLAELDLPPLARAVRDLHAPADARAFERARRRVALERLLALQARLETLRAGAAPGEARCFPLQAAARERWRSALPFAPTAAQARAMDEIAGDLSRARPMRRLLQGDVGSGKTLVALFALAVVASAGGQAAFLVPTEILAEQHALRLAPWLARFGLAPALLTGSSGARERRAELSSLASGERRIAIGTHALFTADVRFAGLDLVVIDEQQRFGVAQKQALLEKGRDVHVLLMTATPIPRTLALCLYGDLDASVLDERPPGRGRVVTTVLGRAQREEAWRELVQSLARGERAFVVCPRIGGPATDSHEAGDDGAAEAAAAESTGRALLRRGLAPFGLEVLHGRVPASERAARLERFRSGASRCLVGTSMVEVGIDVPEATLLVVDGAERFGLAQLHQLRGRVGRGAADARCFLVAQGEDLERLRVLETCDDGFAIAEEDLRRRGMGDLAGARQAGENLEGLALPGLAAELVLRARALVREDPGLAARYREEASLPAFAAV